MQVPARPAGRTDVQVHDLSGEAMIYDPASDRVVRLNRTSRRIWQLCDGRNDAAAMAARLAAETSVGPEVDIAADVRRAIAAFAAAGLLEPERAS